MSRSFWGIVAVVLWSHAAACVLLAMLVEYERPVGTAAVLLLVAALLGCTGLAAYRKAGVTRFSVWLLGAVVGLASLPGAHAKWTLSEYDASVRLRANPRYIAGYIWAGGIRHLYWQYPTYGEWPSMVRGSSNG